MQEQMIECNSVQLWTCVQGEGVPLMLCNGGPGCCDYLAPLAAMLDDLVRVYRWEQRGCGRSEAHPPYDHATCLADLEALRLAFGYERWMMGGHSWGANLALDYAVAYPDRVLALISLSGTGITEAWHADYERALQERGEQVPEFAYPFNPVVNRAGNHSRRAYLQTPDLAERLSALEVPALFIQGGLDLRPPWAAQQVAELLPHARFHLIPEAEHALWLTHPQELRVLMRAFLQEILR